MTQYPDHYHEVLSVMQFDLVDEYSPDGFWKLLIRAHAALSTDLQILSGGPVAAENTRLIHLMMEFFRAKNLRENKGSMTNAQSVRKVLDNRLSYPQSEKIFRQCDIDSEIVASCLPSLEYLMLSSAECRTFLETYFSNLAVYDSYRCAVALTKFACMMANQNAIHMLIAFSQSPFAEALQLIGRSKEDDATDDCCVIIA